MEENFIINKNDITIFIDRMRTMFSLPEREKLTLKFNKIFTTFFENNFHFYKTSVNINGAEVKRRFICLAYG